MKNLARPDQQITDTQHYPAPSSEAVNAILLGERALHTFGLAEYFLDICPNPDP